MSLANIEKAIDLFEKESSYLLQTFANLLVQLGVTYYAAFKIKAPDYSFMTIFGIFVLHIIIIYALHKTHNMAIQFALFLVFSYTGGRILHSVKDYIPLKTAHKIIQLMAAIFLAMFLLGGLLLAGGIAFGKMTVLIMIAVLLVYIVARIIWPVGASEKWLYGIGIAIFTAFIAIDTNIILQKTDEQTPINASMRYYLDLLNLFQILRRRR